MPWKITEHLVERIWHAAVSYKTVAWHCLNESWIKYNYVSNFSETWQSLTYISKTDLNCRNTGSDQLIENALQFKPETDFAIYIYARYKGLKYFPCLCKKMECFVWFSGYKLEIPIVRCFLILLFSFIFLFIYFQFIYFLLSFMFESLKSLQHGKYTINKRSTGAMKVQGSIIYIFFLKRREARLLKRLVIHV